MQPDPVNQDLNQALQSAMIREFSNLTDFQKWAAQKGGASVELKFDPSLKVADSPTNQCFHLSVLDQTGNVIAQMGMTEHVGRGRCNSFAKDFGQLGYFQEDDQQVKCLKIPVAQQVAGAEAAGTAQTDLNADLSQATA